ncbi:MAG: rod shape-determining protein MreD [Candidatus Nitrospinota bacterium M3_3B_026]
MKAVVYAMVVLCCFIVQSTAYDFPGPSLPRPDLALLLAVYGGLRWGRAGGSRFGALAGFIQDCLSYKALGLHFFSKGMIGFFVGRMREKYIADSPATRAMFVLAATVFDHVSYVILAQTFLGAGLFAPVSRGLAPALAVNTLFAFIVLPAIAWAERGVDRLTGVERGKLKYLSREGRRGY